MQRAPRPVERELKGRGSRRAGALRTPVGAYSHRGPIGRYQPGSWRENPVDGRTWGRSDYRVLLIVDIEEYSAAYRNDTIQVQLHADLRRLLITAFDDNGIEPGRYTMDTTGDGWLVSIDPAV